MEKISGICIDGRVYEVIKRECAKCDKCDILRLMFKRVGKERASAVSDIR